MENTVGHAKRACAIEFTGCVWCAVYNAKWVSRSMNCFAMDNWSGILDGNV
jgi:hypothetical protein